ncbi:MAG TPA: hypothetical protein VNG71_10930 [Pyrinomonadaceae bacterium]|nr:hypothetical protein [Pyrinomonadaceae bacterium]
MTFQKFLLGLIAMLMFVAPATAQQTTAQQTNLPPTQLALEVQFYPNVAPGYQVVSPDKRTWSWWGRFAQVPGWKQPTDWPAASAVNINSELAEDGVRVWVSVYLGEMHEQEKDVASYVLHEREKQTVRELADVGVVPFEIKLVRVNLSAIEPPAFKSNAKSIELVSMRPLLATMPSFEVVVRNVSSKNVLAFRQKIFQSARMQIMGMPQGKEGQALIPPGGTYSFNARIATRATPGADGYTPVVLPDQVIVISTAVFDDGTFEGESDAAIEFVAFQKGRSIQLARAIGLLEKASTSKDSVASSVALLRQQVGALPFEVDAAAVQEVRAKVSVPDGRDVKHLIEVSMKGTRDELLNDVVQFQLHNRRTDSAALVEWLATTKERYQAWLNRL